MTGVRSNRKQVLFPATEKNGLRILLVDDDPGDVLLIRMLMEKLPEVECVVDVGDGVEALKFLRGQPPYSDAGRPGLVLMDLNMPRKDGRETLAELRSDPDLCTVPVVIFSTSLNQRDVRETYQLLANAYVVKPIELNELTEMLESLARFWGGVVTLPRAS